MPASHCRSAPARCSHGCGRASARGCGRGGVFAGELFGPHDDFAAWPDVNTHDRTAVERLLDGLDVLVLREDDRDGSSFAGTKHWHVFHIVAIRP